MCQRQCFLFFLVFAGTLFFSSCRGGKLSVRMEEDQKLYIGDDIAIAQTRYGKIQGYILNGVYTFLGVPYGASTSGENRFMPPREPAAWEGIRPALFYGNDAPQEMRDKWKNNASTFTDHWNYYDVSEDCLNLNVWTPALDGKSRPVLVWLHGGGFAAGNSVEQDGYNGANLAKAGNIVFVSVNHRLNAFGFTDFSKVGIPGLAQSGNVGLLDIVAALGWVRDNISQFGGDPGNVTIMGQSGGGAKVCNVISMSSAKGLVHKAVALSGNATEAMPAGLSSDIGLAIWQAGGSDLAALQKMPWEEYYALAHRVASEYVRGMDMSHYTGLFGPVGDGINLPMGTFFMDTSSPSAQIPLLLCSTTSEFSLSKEDAALEDISFDEAVSLLRDTFSQTRAAELVAALRESFPEKKPIELVNLVISGRHNVLATANAKIHQPAPVWLAWFDYNAPLFDGRIRAFHCSDICYWFKNTDLMVTHTGGGKIPRYVSDRMSSALLAFMKTGNPNCEILPRWPAYTREDCPTMVFSQDPELRMAPDKKALELMDPFNPFRMSILTEK